MAGFGAIADGQFIFRRGEAERANHHGGEGVGEFAFEHGAFASDHAVILANFAEEKGRKNVGKKNLLSAFEIALGAIEVLSHHAEIHVFRAENVANLAEHFVDANVGAGIARAVVAGEKQFQFFARLPALAAAEHPLQAGQFDVES